MCVCVFVSVGIPVCRSVYQMRQFLINFERATIFVIGWEVIFKNFIHQDNQRLHGCFFNLLTIITFNTNSQYEGPLHVSHGHAKYNKK